MLVLSGLLIIVLGFAFRLNPLLVVTCAGIVTGLAGGLGLLKTISTLGHAFAESRFIAIVWLVLPVIGLLERAGLKERARTVVLQMRAATAGRVILAYLALRQVSSALGLVSLGGHPQMVRPLIAPMAEGAAERDGAVVDDATRQHIRANAAAADNIGFFFGEDIFIAIGSILLIKGVMEQAGIRVVPTALAVWAMPTAIAAFVIHGVRLLLLDRRLRSQPPAA
jgi:uncharacterized membrane protein